MRSTRLIDLEPLRRLDDEVHVWFAEPGAITDLDTLTYYLAILAPGEKERHKRFHRENDRRHYLVAHALVRLALSSYVGVPPSDWRFSVNEHGRPEIESPEVSLGLRFNLTHANELCACVVTRERDCGIDAEALSSRHNLRKIADRMFAIVEIEAIGDLSSARSRERFFRHWTLREAYCKALGVGLAGSTKNFYFRADDGKPPQIVLARDSGQADQWQFALLRHANSHLVAIAVHRPEQPDLKIVTKTLGAQWACAETS